MRPNWSCKLHAVTRYADPYQPTSPRELNSSVMVGTAVEMMVLSYCSGQGIFCSPDNKSHAPTQQDTWQDIERA